MIKHILFDFDGTIADSGEIGLEILNELSDKYKVKKFTKEELIEINNYPIKERFKMLGIPFYKLPKIVIETLSMYKKYISLIKMFHGMDKVLNELKDKGYNLSIISSNSIENINFFLEKNKLNIFTHIISAKNIFGKNKTISSYLKSNNLKPNEILYVGDELRDIEACKKVNVKIVAVTWGFDSYELLKKSNPDYLIDNPEELINIINNLENVIQ